MFPHTAATTTPIFTNLGTHIYTHIHSAASNSNSNMKIVYIKNGKVLFEFDELQWCVLIHFYAWKHEGAAEWWMNKWRRRNGKAVGDRLRLFGAFYEDQLKLFSNAFLCVYAKVLYISSARSHTSYTHERKMEKRIRNRNINKSLISFSIHTLKLLWNIIQIFHLVHFHQMDVF